MSVEFFMRLIGMGVMGVGGLFLGIYLARELGGMQELWGVVFAMVGALMGLVVTPFLTTRPIRAFRRLVAQTSAQTMVAGLSGLIVGLIIGALVSFPLSLLPAPLSQILPFLGALIFAYVGVSVFVMREHDIFSLLRSRFSIFCRSSAMCSARGKEGTDISRGPRGLSATYSLEIKSNHDVDVVIAIKLAEKGVRSLAPKHSSAHGHAQPVAKGMPRFRNQQQVLIRWAVEGE